MSDDFIAKVRRYVELSETPSENEVREAAKSLAEQKELFPEDIALQELYIELLETGLDSLTEAEFLELLTKLKGTRQ